MFFEQQSQCVRSTPLNYLAVLKEIVIWLFIIFKIQLNIYGVTITLSQLKVIFFLITSGTSANSLGFHYFTSRLRI